MSKLKELFRRKVDERQEMELLKVEHTAFWITYWLLFAAIIIQETILQMPPEQLMAEKIIFGAACLALFVGCIRKGLWSFQTQKVPGVKTFVVYSLIGAAAGVAYGIYTVIKFQLTEIPAIITIICMDAVMIFVACFVLFLISGKLIKDRAKKLEEKAMEDEEE